VEAMQEIPKKIDKCVFLENKVKKYGKFTTAIFAISGHVSFAAKGSLDIICHI